MNIGRLRHRIKIQKQRYRPSDYGATIAEWHDLHNVWAEVKPLSGRELFVAQQVQAETSAQIWLRYLADVDTTMRVEFNGRFYQILSVINYRELNKSLILHCKELHNGER